MKWQRVDLTLLDNPPGRLEPFDECFFAREYASGKPYQHSDTNQLIMNFKKPVSQRGTYAWKYKERAISQFAQELLPLLASIAFKFYLAHIPSSKCRADAAYDCRLEDVIRLVTPRCPLAVQHSPILRRSTVAAAHVSRGARPTIPQVEASMDWEVFPAGELPVVFIDDVLTSGTTFKACQNLVRLNAPHVPVYGVFWARTVWEKVDPDEFDL